MQFRAGQKVVIDPNVNLARLRYWVGDNSATPESIGRGTVMGMHGSRIVVVFENMGNSVWNMKRGFLTLAKREGPAHPLTPIFMEKA